LERNSTLFNHVSIILSSVLSKNVLDHDLILCEFVLDYIKNIMKNP